MLRSRLSNLLHTCLFLGTAGLLSIYKYLLSVDFTFKIFEICLTVLGVHVKEIFYGYSRVFVEIKHELDLAGETVELNSRVSDFSRNMAFLACMTCVADRPHKKGLNKENSFKT